MQIRLKQPQRQRASLIDLTDGDVSLLEMVLAERGVVIVEQTSCLPDLGPGAFAASDLLIVYIGDNVAAGVDALPKICTASELAVLVISTRADADETHALIDAGAHSVLVLGVAADRIENAIASAVAVQTQIAGHRQAADRARRNLEERKLIERAKGILMDTRQISEREAFRELQQTSMQNNESLPQVARKVIAAKELLG